MLIISIHAWNEKLAFKACKVVLCMKQRKYTDVANGCDQYRN